MDECKVTGDARILALRQAIRLEIYQWISRGLAIKHILIFLTMITFRLMQKGVIDVEYKPEEMSFLMKCLPKVGETNTLDWLPDLNWMYVQRLLDLERFGSKFGDDLSSNAPGRFRDWY